MAPPQRLVDNALEKTTLRRAESQVGLRQNRANPLPRIAHCSGGGVAGANMMLLTVVGVAAILDEDLDLLTCFGRIDGTELNGLQAKTTISPSRCGTNELDVEAWLYFRSLSQKQVSQSRPQRRTARMQPRL